MPVAPPQDRDTKRLLESKTIILSEESVALPYYLSLPADDQDPERANRLMAQDGFQQARPT